MKVGFASGRTPVVVFSDMKIPPIQLQYIPLPSYWLPFVFELKHGNCFFFSDCMRKMACVVFQF